MQVGIVRIWRGQYIYATAIRSISVDWKGTRSCIPDLECISFLIWRGALPFKPVLERIFSCCDTRWTLLDRYVSHSHFRTLFFRCLSSVYKKSSVAIMAGRKSAATLVDTLKNVWGYEDFRGEQAAVCQALCKGQDCSVFWATGAGKSICYQLPAFHLKKSVIVISPLISLMQDQVLFNP